MGKRAIARVGVVMLGFVAALMAEQRSAAAEVPWPYEFPPNIEDLGNKDAVVPNSCTDQKPGPAGTPSVTGYPAPRSTASAMAQ